MSHDIEAARRFIHANGRLIDRHRLSVMLDGAPIEPLLTALRAYRNPDGGFGHALEPDVRCPGSQPAAPLQALEVLVDAGAYDEPMVADAVDWVGAIAAPDGGVPTVLPSAAGRSSTCSGPPGRPWSGAGWPPSEPSVCYVPTHGSAVLVDTTDVRHLTSMQGSSASGPWPLVLSSW